MPSRPWRGEKGLSPSYRRPSSSCFDETVVFFHVDITHRARSRTSTIRLRAWFRERKHLTDVSVLETRRSAEPLDRHLHSHDPSSEYLFPSRSRSPLFIKPQLVPKNDGGAPLLPSNLPSFVVYPKNANDVRKALEFAREKSLSVTVKTSGHSYLGSSIGPNSLNLNLREFEKSSDEAPYHGVMYCEDPIDGSFGSGFGSAWKHGGQTTSGDHDPHGEEVLTAPGVVFAGPGGGAQGSSAPPEGSATAAVPGVATQPSLETQPCWLAGRRDKPAVIKISAGELWSDVYRNVDSFNKAFEKVSGPASSSRIWFFCNPTRQHQLHILAT